MALSAELEALLGELEKVDAAAAKEQRTILEKHTSLQRPIQEAVLRQSEFSRKSNEIQAQKKTYDETMTWYQRNKPVYDQTVKDLSDARERITSLEAEVQAKASEAAAAKAAAGEGGGDPQAVAKAVMDSLKGQVPTSAELAKMITAETEKQAASARERFFKEDVPAALAFQTAMNDVQWRYRDEFGKSMNRLEFVKFMTDNKLSDPIEAYERYTEKDRREREVSAEVDKRVAEEKKKLMADFVPGSTGPTGTGHLQTRLNKKDANDPLFSQDIELGDNAAASAAAAELRAEGRV